ncbi:reductase [Seminavis robusta]|uniref:Reductase n=1 Tax=Seminavis robusta TaxID=568900 RepID=A0A9N8F1L3_9STRA|nr:reductase [Seminavis robusta]|eukprot:Sro2549_g330910.1 reductase (463) ;mRNA; r:9013-10565
MLGRLEANIIAESALIDKASGRVFWEGGSSTLSGSLNPKLGIPGLAHLKSTILTTFLLVALLSFLARWIRSKLETPGTPLSNPPQGGPHIYQTVGLWLLQWTLLRTPEFSTQFVILIAILYLVEAYTCSTRRYLANSISSPNDVEAYIEQLRKEPPVVTWKVRCFHYEKPLLLSPLRCALAVCSFLVGSKANTSKSSTDDLPVLEREHVTGPFRRKVITHEATENYTFDSFVDATIAGVWKRQDSFETEVAPFTKIILSKILILANEDAKKDYFKQQSAFVSSQGMRDSLAEYSTTIEVPSFKRRLLAIRPVKGVPSAKLFRLNTFWICTFLGLSLPYRIWFARRCDALRVTVVKETYYEEEAKTSTFSTWFTSGKPEAPVRLPGANRNAEAFRQQMENMALYARSGEKQATLPVMNTSTVRAVNTNGTLSSEKTTSKAEQGSSVATPLAQEKNQGNNRREN